MDHLNKPITVPVDLLQSLTNRILQSTAYQALSSKAKPGYRQRMLTFGTFLYLMNRDAYNQNNQFIEGFCSLEDRTLLTGDKSYRKEMINPELFDLIQGDIKAKYNNIVPVTYYRLRDYPTSPCTLVTPEMYIGEIGIERIRKVFKRLDQNALARFEKYPAIKIELDNQKALLTKFPAFDEVVAYIKANVSVKEERAKIIRATKNCWGKLTNRIIYKTYDEDRIYSGWLNLPKLVRNYILSYNGLNLLSSDLKQAHPSIFISLLCGFINQSTYEAYCQLTGHDARGLAQYKIEHITNKQKNEMIETLIELQTNTTITKKTFIRNLFGKNIHQHKAITEFLTSRGETGKLILEHIETIKKQSHKKMWHTTVHFEAVLMEAIKIKAHEAGIQTLGIHDECLYDSVPSEAFQGIWNNSIEEFGLLQPSTYEKLKTNESDDMEINALKAKLLREHKEAETRKQGEVAPTRHPQAAPTPSCTNTPSNNNHIQGGDGGAGSQEQTGAETNITACNNNTITLPEGGDGEQQASVISKEREELNKMVAESKQFKSAKQMLEEDDFWGSIKTTNVKKESIKDYKF